MTMIESDSSRTCDVAVYVAAGVGPGPQAPPVASGRKCQLEFKLCQCTVVLATGNITTSGTGIGPASALARSLSVALGVPLAVPVSHRQSGSIL